MTHWMNLLEEVFVAFKAQYFEFMPSLQGCNLDSKSLYTKLRLTIEDPLDLTIWAPL